MSLYRMNAALLELSPGADRFVQAYTTQTPSAARGAFIDAKGRAVAVYHAIRIDADRFRLAVARGTVERLKQHLKNYLFLTGAELRELPDGVYCDLADGSVRTSVEPLEAAASEEEFRSFRLAAGSRWALQGIDYDDPMLLNLADPELVSFTKGCYLGQEIMARVHYRGKPPLRLAAVSEADCPSDLRANMTSRVRDPKTGETKGFVFLPAA